MKLARICLMTAVALFATVTLADAANVLISFSTTADTYADGTAVKDGEWYALCWSADGKFDGLNLDCTPVDPAEKVLILAPLAKGGRCPYVVFQVDSAKAPAGGNYFVYLLDTRDVTEGAVSEATVAEDGRRVPANVVNGSAAAQSYTASASVGANVATAASSGSVAADGWKAVQPKITGFELVGDAKVKITVAGMMNGLDYKVKMGSDLGNMTTTDVKSQAEDGKAVFYVNDKDARFFTVVAE